LALAGVFGGVGGALISPALSAAYLDLTIEANRSRVMGLKESAAAMGGILGPTGVVIASQWVAPLDIFRAAAGFTLLGVLLAFFTLGCSRKRLEAGSGIRTRMGCYQRAGAD
jgi:MFS family permease